MIQKRQSKQNNGKKRNRSALARTGRNVALCAMCIGAAFSSVSRVSGKSVLIIDDVTTTGSTGEALAEKLKKAGAERVELLTIASVPPKAGY